MFCNAEGSVEMGVASELTVRGVATVSGEVFTLARKNAALKPARLADTPLPAD
jgi:hypothetical protein